MSAGLDGVLQGLKVMVMGNQPACWASGTEHGVFHMHYHITSPYQPHFHFHSRKEGSTIQGLVLASGPRANRAGGGVGARQPTVPIITPQSPSQVGVATALGPLGDRPLGLACDFLNVSSPVC